MRTNNGKAEEPLTLPSPPRGEGTKEMPSPPGGEGTKEMPSPLGGEGRVRGQVIAETAILMMLIPFLVSGMIYFSKIILINQKLAMAARYGAFLISSQRINRSVAVNEVRHFLADDEPRLKLNHIPEPEFTAYRPGGKNPAARFYKLTEVKVSYNIQVPLLLRRFLSDGNGYYRLTEKCVIQESLGAISHKKGIY